jgi:1-acyl-sn-glycerol-3-phosphate acyltransferase
MQLEAEVKGSADGVGLLGPDADLLLTRALTRKERAHIRFVRATLAPGLLQWVIRWCQRRLGSLWIHHATRNLRQVHGLERLPALELSQSYLCVANHRSFFDMYVVTAELVRRGLSHRILFPVRAKFFYDSWLGFFVNGIMSFFAMYPPIFRERSRAALNLRSLDELARLLKGGGIFAGLHPEGTRNKGEDAYALLPGQRGVGKVIHGARVSVLPVFINGLINDLSQQISGNFDGSGQPIHIVFGAPVDFGELLDEPGTPRVHRQIVERVMLAIGKLAEEERALRGRPPAQGPFNIVT